LISRQFKPDLISVFSDKISQKESPSLLICGFNDGLPLYTKNNIVPNTKYFFYPNISYELYPLIRDSQLVYIKNKAVDFIVISTDFRYYVNYVEELNRYYNCVLSYSKANNESVFLYSAK